MAVKTADTLIKHNFGSMTLYVATFSTSDIDDGDDWFSGIPHPVAAWGNLTDDSTANSNGQLNIGVATAATGAFKFYTGESNRTGVVYVLTKTIT